LSVAGRLQIKVESGGQGHGRRPSRKGLPLFAGNKARGKRLRGLG
jgi:hypothetical protein